MFAVAFDLHVKAALAASGKPYPKQVYDELGDILRKHGFAWTQGSLYVSTNEDMSKLFAAMNDIKALPWAKAGIKDIRAFRVEQWSDFTGFL